MVTCNLDDLDDIEFKKGVFRSQVNMLNHKFSSLHGSLKAVLFQNYCCSFYGCQTWDLDSRSVVSMNTEWNKAVRRTLLLPYQTRTSLLPLLISGKSFATQHKMRMIKFLGSFCDSDNSHVAYIGERASRYAHGPLGRNHTRCIGGMRVDPPETDLLARSQAIKELIDARDGIVDLPGYTRDEIITSIEFLSTF